MKNRLTVITKRKLVNLQVRNLVDHQMIRVPITNNGTTSGANTLRRTIAILKFMKLVTILWQADT